MTQDLILPQAVGAKNRAISKFEENNENTMESPKEI
jgi:hypothetical protein